jgi:hypothetical protein
MQWLLKVIQDPKLISLGCSLYIISYYVVSAICLRAEKNNLNSSPLKKNKALDVITSVLWFLTAFILVWSLLELCIRQQISLGYLVLYYFFFIFLFAFCYGLLEWHFPGMLIDVDSSTWEGEFQYVMISVQTQTTLGYTRAKPGNLVTELIACIQALLGMFFCIVFIAQAVGLMTVSI